MEATTTSSYQDPLIQPVGIISSHEPLPLPLSELPGQAEIFLADFSMHHTGSYADFEDSRSWKPLELSPTDRRHIKSTPQERVFWREVMFSLMQDTRDSGVHLKRLEVHSTAQTMMSESIWENLKSFRDTESDIVVDHLVLSGRSWDYTWLNWTKVTGSITVRGCKHHFGSRSWNYLASVDPCPSSLILAGGSDMDKRSLQHCMQNLAFTQRIRRLKGLEPFADITMDFDLSEDLVSKCRDAWMQMPDAYTLDAEFCIINTKQGFVGPSSEEQRFRSGATINSTPPIDQASPVDWKGARSGPSLTAKDLCGCNVKELCCTDADGHTLHKPIMCVDDEAARIAREHDLQDSVETVVEDIFQSRASMAPKASPHEPMWKHQERA